MKNSREIVLKNLVEKLNDKLKKISTYEEFEELYQLIKDNDLCIFGKRRNIELYQFTEVSKDRMHYLYNDYYSTGECMVKNLWKVAKISR